MPGPDIIPLIGQTSSNMVHHNGMQTVPHRVCNIPCVGHHVTHHGGVMIILSAPSLFDARCSIFGVLAS